MWRREKRRVSLEIGRGKDGEMQRIREMGRKGNGEKRRKREEKMKWENEKKSE